MINDHYRQRNSTHNRELFPRKQTYNMEGGEEDSDDESLLAGFISPDPEVEEEDDASLLPATGLPEPGTQVDYLEGMTSEMFGDDEAFDMCDMHEDLEEVEALPDAHFGLLGNSGSPVQPQGCIDDLPEEVLWQVLWQVPAQDLYRNVSLVCHRWRNIVEDPKVKQPSKLYIRRIKYLNHYFDCICHCSYSFLFQFVPYKKKYYRCMMGEKDTVADICNTLKTSGISGQPEHRIRKLVM